MATNEETYDQPLAMTTTNIFEVNHEDAYDSDVDECPNAAAVFMANLSSTSATNSQVNEVHSNDNPIFDNVDYQLSQEMHQDEHLDSDAETEIDDNTIINLTIEKKNLLIINECLIAECLEKDICSIVLTSDLVVPPSSNCLCEDLRSACDREHTKVLELEAEISKQKQLFIESEKRFAFLEQNYALETDDIQLKDTITSLRIQLDGLKVENVSLKRRDVYQSSKYIPPPKRANWVKPTLLPKKKQVTFQEPPRTSNRPTQKPPVQHNKSLIVPAKVLEAPENHNVNTTKTAWRPTGKIVGSVKPQWKPTGRHFALYDTVLFLGLWGKPIVEPLELNPGI
ncbi:hypothetical protein Tco_0499607 [Tanacetum coccineum]